MSDIQTLVETLTGSSLSDEACLNSAKTRALAWARVSTEEQEERGLSIPEQLREIREYAEKHDIEIVEEYQDAASAFQREDKRVQFHRMIEAAKQDSRVSAILVHDFSRFSRDSLRARELVRDLRKVGIRVVSLNDVAEEARDPSTCSAGGCSSVNDAAET